MSRMIPCALSLLALLPLSFLLCSPPAVNNELAWVNLKSRHSHYERPLKPYVPDPTQGTGYKWCSFGLGRMFSFLHQHFEVFAVL